MASLGGTSRGKGRDSNASIAKAPVPSPSDTTKSVPLDNQDRNNKPTKDPSNTTPEIQDSQSDTSERNNGPSFLKPIHEVRAIIQNDLIKSLARTGKDSFDRHLQLQRTSPFWSKLFTPPPEGADLIMTYRAPPLLSREWAEYVVDASRIFFEAGVSVKKVVNIFNRAIRFAAICLLNRGTEKIYFEDGKNVFYEFASCGMPKELKAKYKGFLKGMRDSILEGREEEAQSDDEMEMEVKSESGDESSSDASEASQSEAGIAAADDTEMTLTTSQEESDRQETTDILSVELSTTPPEVKPSTLTTVEESDSHTQPTQDPPQTKEERNRKRQNLKRKERRKRSLARLRKLFSESKDTTKRKTDQRRRRHQNRKRKEKMKELQDGLQGCNISA